MQPLLPKSFLLPVLYLLLSASWAWGQTPAAPVPVSYALNDGTRLTGYLSLPRDYREGKKNAAILLIHGGVGDGGQDLSRAEGILKTRPVQDHLCRRYAVFSAAYHTDYFGGPQEIASMAAALRALAGLPQVDPARIAAVGVSHGGYLALMCAGHPRISASLKAAVSISGVVDVAAFFQHRYRSVLERKPGAAAASPLGRALGWPPDKDAGTRENYARVSVLTYAGNFQAPVLVVHGAGDNLVPVGQAQRLREALAKEHRTFEYLEVPTGKIGGHFIFLTSKAVWEKIDSFLKRYL